MKLQFRLEIAGEVEVNELTEAEVFRQLRSQANWRDLINDEEAFELAAENRRLLELIRRDPEALKRLVLKAAVSSAEDKLHSYLQQFDAENQYSDILRPFLTQLPPEVASGFQEAAKNDALNSYADPLLNAIVVSLSGPVAEVLMPDVDSASESPRPDGVFEVVRYLRGRGVRVIVEPPDAPFYLGHEQALTEHGVVDWLEDADGLWAKQLGLTREQFLMWKAWEADYFRCHGKNKKGDRCKNHIFDGGERLESFRPGYSEFCSHHKPKLTEPLAPTVAQARRQERMDAWLEDERTKHAEYLRRRDANSVAD